MIDEKDEDLNRDNRAHTSSAQHTSDQNHPGSDKAGFPPQEPVVGEKGRKSRNTQFAALALAAVAIILILAWIWPVTA